MKNKFLLLVAALVLSTTATFAASHSQISNSGIQASGQTESDMKSMIIEYMGDRGVIVMFIVQEQGTQNYIVKDTFGVWYRVYTSNGVITGANEFDY